MSIMLVGGRPVQQTDLPPTQQSLPPPPSATEVSAAYQALQQSLHGKDVNAGTMRDAVTNASRCSKISQQAIAEAALLIQAQYDLKHPAPGGASASTSTGNAYTRAASELLSYRQGNRQPVFDARVMTSAQSAMDGGELSAAPGQAVSNYDAAPSTSGPTPAPMTAPSGVPTQSEAQPQIDAFVHAGLSAKAAAGAVAILYGGTDADLKALGLAPATAGSSNGTSTQTSAPFAGTVAGNDAPVGISQTQLAPGETPWQVYEQSPLVDPHNPSQFLQELAASNSLDPQPFDSRPANSPDAAHHLQINATVTVLDSTRLGMLQQQRQDLASLAPLDAMPTSEWRNKYDGDQVTSMLAPLRQSIASELNYAAQNMPDPVSQLSALAAPIAARAPESHVFQEALSGAEQDVTAQWTAQGRAPNALGTLVHDQASGDTAALTRDATSQLHAVAEAAWQQSGGDANAVRAAVAARGGCYVSYLNAAAAPVMKQVVDNVLQTVLVDEPVDRIVAASQRSPAAGMVQLQKEVNLAIDPTTNAPYRTSGQIAAIMNDPRVMAAMKHFVDGAYDMQDLGGDGSDVNSNAPLMSEADFSSGLSALGAACQDAFTSDALAPANSPQSRGQGLTGKSAVDAIATYISNKPGGSQAIGGATTSDVALGNVALPVAIAAADVHAGRDPGSRGNSLSDDSVIDALRFGLDNYTKNVLDPLESRIQGDDIPLAAGQSEWGSLLTTPPSGASKSQQQANTATLQGIQKKLMTPTVLKDIGDQTQALLTLRSMQNVLDAYPQIRGASGYTSDEPDLSFYPVTASSNFQKAWNSAISTATNGNAEQMASKAPFTQFWWLSRTIVSGSAYAAEEMGHASQRDGNLSKGVQSILNFLVGQPSATPDDPAPVPKSTFDAAGLRGASGAMAALWSFNAAYLIGTAPQSTTKPLEYDNVAFGVNQLYFAATELADFINPNWKQAFFGSIVEHPGEAPVADTPTRALLNSIRTSLDESDLPSGLSTSLKFAVGSVLGDTADFAYFVSTVFGIGALANAPGDNLGSQIAYGGGAFAALTFLGKAGSQMAGEFGTETIAELAGKTLLGLSADAWTGVGVVVNFLAALVQFGVSLHQAAHSLDVDRAWLDAQGVPDSISDPMTRHMTTIEGGTSAGGFITAYFREQGKTNADMIAWMKSLSDGDEADRIATYAKEQSVGQGPNGSSTITQAQIQAFRQFLTESPDEQEATLHPIPRGAH